MASVDFREDVVGSERLMRRTAENYRTIRNKLFSMFSAISTTSIPGEMRCRSKSWKRSTSTCFVRPCAMTADVIRWYDEFAFHKIYHRINDFCVVELSAFYFDVLKDRLYTFAANSAGATGGADGYLAHRGGVGPFARAHHEFYL